MNTQYYDSLSSSTKLSLDVSSLWIGSQIGVAMAIGFVFILFLSLFFFSYFVKKDVVDFYKMLAQDKKNASHKDSKVGGDSGSI